MSTKKFVSQLRFIIPLIVLLILPAAFQGSYIVSFFTVSFIWVIVATSMRVPMVLGLGNFAHISYMAVGAYASALLTTRLGISFWAALPLSALITGVAILLLYPLLRAKGAYFFLGSWALGYALILVIYTQWRDVLAGPMGIAGIPAPMEAFNTSPEPYYYLAFGLTLLIIFVLYRLERSRVGMEWRAIRLADDLAESLGINLLRQRMIALILSGVFVGIAGSVYAHYLRFISPDNFGFAPLMLALTWVLVGGRESIWGPILGVLVLRLITLAVGGLSQWELIIYSVALILSVVLLPEGLVSAPQRIKKIFRKSKGEIPRRLEVASSIGADQARMPE